VSPDSRWIPLATVAAVLGCTPETAPTTDRAQLRPSAEITAPVTSPTPTPPPAPAAPVAPELALTRSGRWLADFPQDQLRFDAAIVLDALVSLRPTPELEQARERALAVAEHDTDNPMRRFWDPSAKAPRDAVQTWSTDDDRINTNRVVIEALHCREHGWREQTERYASGPMRDQGGYRSTHAMWALVIAHRNGCRRMYGEDAIVDLAGEMARHQPAPAKLESARDFDLYAERTLMVQLADGLDLDGRLPDTDEWVRTLLSTQNDDGTWGVPDPDNEYMRFHATMVAAWAIALAR
jgi:hypothetical protein